MTEPLSLDFEEVRRLLPQSHPFLMVDKVTALFPGERIVSVKNVTGNERFFEGHFPGFAVMPAALILEGLAQSTILLTRKSAPAGAVPPAGAEVYLFGAVHARMHRPVFPGDVLRYEVKLLKMYGTGGAAEGNALVDDVLCATAEMYFSKADPAELRRSRREGR